MEEFTLNKNGQWSLESLTKSTTKTRKFGEYTIHSKPAGYKDTDTGGEGAEPRDVHEHEVHHNGKKIGTLHTADADGQHINIGDDLPEQHSAHVDKHIVSKL